MAWRFVLIRNIIYHPIEDGRRRTGRARRLENQKIRRLENSDWRTPVKSASLVFCEEFNGVNRGRRTGRARR